MVECVQHAPLDRIHILGVDAEIARLAIPQMLVAFVILVMLVLPLSREECAILVPLELFLPQAENVLNVRLAPRARKDLQFVYNVVPVKRHSQEDCV